VPQPDPLVFPPLCEQLTVIIIFNLQKQIGPYGIFQDQCVPETDPLGMIAIRYIGLNESGIGEGESVGQILAHCYAAALKEKLRIPGHCPRTAPLYQVTAELR